MRVVEFAQNAAVPQCARLLAGMGADVVKVEPPEGDAMRGLAGLGPSESRAYAAINPGKRGIVVDLADPAAGRVVDALVDWADVCLVGVKAADVDRFGLGWDRVHARNPRLVQLMLTAFGPEGDDAEQPGYDVLVQGRSGLGFSMSRTLDGLPLPVRPAFIDFATGQAAATAVVAALWQRDRTGEGQRVDTSLLGTAITLGTPMLATFDRDERALGRVAETIDSLREAGVDFETHRQAYDSMVPAGDGVFRLYFRHYQTADGLISVAGMSPALFTRFHAITGLPRPAGLDASTVEFQQVVDAAEALFRTRTTDTWIRELRAAGYPCSRFAFPYEAVDDPQVRANDYVVELEHPTFGGYRTAGMPFRFSASTSGVTAPSPRLGEHTRAVLAEIGFDPATIDELHTAGTVASLTTDD